MHPISTLKGNFDVDVYGSSKKAEVEARGVLAAAPQADAGTGVSLEGALADFMLTPPGEQKSRGTVHQRQGLQVPVKGQVCKCIGAQSRGRGAAKGEKNYCHLQQGG